MTLEVTQAKRVAPLSGGALLLLVFLPFALGHYLSCLLRGVNAVLAPQLLASLALTPLQTGMLTSIAWNTRLSRKACRRRWPGARRLA